MSETIKNMLVGIFVIAACLLLVSLIMFLQPQVGDEKETLYVRFTNINGINVGTRVLFAGKAVGEVKEISVVKDARQQKTDTLGQVYYYQLTLKVDSSVKVYNTDEVSLATSGLLGEKSVSITPRLPPKGVTPQRITNQPIYGDSIDPIQSAFHELSQLANTMEGTFDEITLWIQRYGQTVGCAVESAGDLLSEAYSTVKTFNALGIMEDIKVTSANLALTMEQVQGAMDTLERGQVFLNIGETVNNIRTVTGDLATGKGTIGALITSNDLYLRVMNLMNKANTLMNDINHYGVLFHLNKQWQRQRLQRVNLLHTLDSPESFRDYFETEITQIDTAMGRLSQLVERAERSPEREEIMESDPFKRDFKELMQRADQLSENLRLFNEKLVEQTGS